MTRTYKEHTDTAAKKVPKNKQIAYRRQAKLWSEEDIALCAAYERAFYGDTPLARELRRERDDAHETSTN